MTTYTQIEKETTSCTKVDKVDKGWFRGWFMDWFSNILFRRVEKGITTCTKVEKE